MSKLNLIKRSSTSFQKILRSFPTNCGKNGSPICARSHNIRFIWKNSLKFIFKHDSFEKFTLRSLDVSGSVIKSHHFINHGIEGKKKRNLNHLKLYSSRRNFASSSSSLRLGKSLGYDSIFSELGWKSIEKVLSLYRELEKTLTTEGASQNDIKDIAVKLSKLSTKAELIQEIANKRQELRDLDELLLYDDSDDELVKLANTDKNNCIESLITLEKELLEYIQPIEDEKVDQRNAILEVRAGVGGEEAALFASDLFIMYEKFSARQRWKFEILDFNKTSNGGFSDASAMISGQDVFGNLQYETGVHRVQRVPVTESAGRVHTSTAIVLLYPELEEVELHIQEKDLRIDTYRSSGNGGQSVNTTDSAVRITHLPTNTVVTCQNERSQIANRIFAMKMLRAKLYEKMRLEQEEKFASNRRKQMGKGDRNERIRTYNFNQRRVTDHRTNFSVHDVEGMLSGEYVDQFIYSMKKKESFGRLESLNQGEIDLV